MYIVGECSDLHRQGIVILSGNQKGLVFFKKNYGFTEWEKAEHPDFPGQHVEVGGIDPFVLFNHPYKLVPNLAMNKLNRALSYKCATQR